MIDIRPAEFPRDLPLVRALFTEYADSLGFSLCFQGFDDELADLPGKYAPPAGRLLLAWNGDDAIGCAPRRVQRSDSSVALQSSTGRPRLKMQFSATLAMSARHQYGRERNP